MQKESMLEALKAFGFDDELTGGGCVCKSRYWHNGQYIWATDLGGLDQPGPGNWIIGYYPPGYDGEGLQHEWRSSDSAPLPFEVALRAAVEIAESDLPSTDTLSDELTEWANENGLPVMSADELQHEIAGQGPFVQWPEKVQAQWQWLAKFIERWNESQAVEDFRAAIAARGES